MTCAPIALFAYNRPDHVQRVIEALRMNPEAAESKLFIYSDAPKNDATASAVGEVRRLAHSTAGFRSVTVVEQPHNLGVSRSIIGGVTDLTRQFGSVIVLEDDLMPASGFLQYMNDALATYTDDARVISVHAYVWPMKDPLPETFFLRGADCWGWATWARGWELFEADGTTLLEQLRARALTHEFDLDASYPYTRMLEEQIAGRNDSWAVRWYASAFLRGLLTLYPGSSQVQNIGADGTGTHVGCTGVFFHERWGEAVRVGGIPVEESTPARHAFAAFLRSTNPPLAKRLLARLLGK